MSGLSIIFTVEVNCTVLSRGELGELMPPLENEEILVTASCLKFEIGIQGLPETK